MTTHHFPTPGTVHLRVDNAAGSVTIATHDEPSTDVELSFEGPGDDETFLDQARVEANPTDDGYEVIVEIPRRHGGFGGMLRWLVMNHGVRVAVKVPLDATIDVRTASADVEGDGPFSSASAKTASGRVQLGSVTGDVDVRTASGKVVVESVGGNASVDTASGRIRLGSLSGEAHLRSASGRVTVEAAAAHLGVRTASGAVTVGDAAGDIEIATASGALRVDRLSGGQAKIRSVSGSILVGVAKGTTLHVDAQALSGSIDSEIELSPDWSPSEEHAPHELDLEIHSVSGSVRVVRADET